jgi:protocatechuate 3,4-dioxygenase beta subunit
MIRMGLLALAMASTAAQLLPSPDPKPMPVTGVVVDGAGRPVGDAEVYLAEALPPELGRRLGLELWWATLTGPEEGTPPILVYARTGVDGNFKLELPAKAVARRSPLPLVVWAATAGREARVAFRRLPRVILADDPPVRIVFGPTAHADLTILTPDRKPAAGARVVPTRSGELPIPEPLGRMLADDADAHGRVVIAGLERPEIGQVRVEAAGFGTQVQEISDAAAVALAPVGRIDGRLMAPDKRPIRGVSVRATSQLGGYAGSGQGGSARVLCDEQGRFEIPAIAAGRLALALEFDPAKDCPWHGDAPKGLFVKPDRTTEVAIALRETIRVRGRVREREMNRPISGVKVALNGHHGGDRFAVTDADGRFAGRILRDVNQPYGWPLRFPAPLYQAADMMEAPQRMPRSGETELDLPPIELRRGADVRGTVVGEDGQPVPGAEVEATWSDPRGVTQAALARADRSGGFVLHGIDPIAELDVTARDHFAASPIVTIRAATAAERPIALVLSPRGTAPLRGRVVDPSGGPIAGAEVRLWRQLRARNGRVVLADPVADDDGGFVLRSGADGRFRTRRRCPAAGDYYAEATAPGRLSARSAAVAGESDTPATLVRRRVRDIEGRVVDRQARPIAEALVRQSGDGPMPTEALTGADGRFRLPGAIDGSALILAEKAGFRSSLQPADATSKPVEIVLARPDEPPVAVRRTRPPALPVEEEKALAHRLIEPLVASVLARGDDVAKYRVLVDAAEMDPHATIEWLDEAKFGDPDYGGYVRQVLATALAGESPDEATAVVEACPSPGAKAAGYLALVDAAPSGAPERRRALLDQALLNGKTATPLVQRFNMLGQIADRLIDLGDAEWAGAVLREARDVARNLPEGDTNTKHCLLYITAGLSRLDLPAALKILADQEEIARKTESGDRSRIYGRFYCRIAYRLADRSPDVAERLLDRVSIRPWADRDLVAICDRMAPKDLARARRIAASRISPDSPTLRPYALGLMAQAIAATDRAGAVRLLDEAFDDLGRLAEAEPEDREPAATVVAGALLPVVEQVEPGRLAGFLDRAVLMRRARGDQSRSGEYGLARTTALLAMTVARYDRGLAARILRPELDRLGSNYGLFGTDYLTPTTLAALALIDPNRAVAMVEALPEDPGPAIDPEATRAQARRSVARVLARHGDERWRTVVQQFLYFWTPDQRYF